MPLSDKQFPYTGPYGLPTSTHRAKGPTAEALKRICGRMGVLDWTDYDQHYNLSLEHALDKLDPGKDGYGQGRWKLVRGLIVPAGRDHAGEYAADLYSRKLVQDEAGATNEGDDEARVQKRITEFWTIAIANAGAWHYGQMRPGRVNVNPAAGGFSDCSLMVIQAVYYAGRMTGVPVEDPARMSFSGYGNTDWFEDDWPKIGSPFRVGDLAHFHSERHVIQCIKAGTVSTAVWGSNGREAAPERVVLSSYNRFPGEYLYTVRPTLLVAL